jgi:hypothetical protein
LIRMAIPSTNRRTGGRPNPAPPAEARHGGRPHHRGGHQRGNGGGHGNGHGGGHGRNGNNGHRTHGGGKGHQGRPSHKGRPAGQAPSPRQEAAAGEPSGIGNVTFMQRPNAPRREAGSRAQR